ncbi:PucR family transcriptional regulator, partial [Streptococcus pyogenes]
MELKDYFPEMQVGPHPLGDKEWVSIKEGDQYVHFPKSCLSEKERLLLEVGLGQC